MLAVRSFTDSPGPFGRANRNGTFACNKGRVAKPRSFRSVTVAILTEDWQLPWLFLLACETRGHGPLIFSLPVKHTLSLQSRWIPQGSGQPNAGQAGQDALCRFKKGTLLGLLINARTAMEEPDHVVGSHRYRRSRTVAAG